LLGIAVVKPGIAVVESVQFQSTPLLCVQILCSL